MAVPTKRHLTMHVLAALNEPCPGCWKVIHRNYGDFHHSVYRESVGQTDEQKAALYDLRNGTRVCRKCHTTEPIGFNLRAAVLVFARYQWKHAPFSDYKKKLEGLGITQLPDPVVLELWEDRPLIADKLCLSCCSLMVRDFINPLSLPKQEGNGQAICLRCLRRMTVSNGEYYGTLYTEFTR